MNNGLPVKGFFFVVFFFTGVSSVMPFERKIIILTAGPQELLSTCVQTFEEK